jgi:pilus assembly protein CpaB
MEGIMRRSWISLAIGVALALLAIVLLNNYIAQLRGPGQSTAVVPTNVLVAAKDLPFGTKLDAMSVKVVPWPRDSVPQGAFASLDEMLAPNAPNAPNTPNGPNQIAAGPRILLAPVVAGEPLLRSKISGFGARPTLSRQVSDGMRALSVRIDDVSGVAGFLLPGDRVDIMLTRRVGTAQQNLLTDILLQNITVLGIDQSADQSSEKPIVAKTATVEVTPEQAQKLKLAEQAGSLSLSLRNVATVDQVPATTVVEAELTSKRAAPVQRAQPVQRAAPARAAPAPAPVIAPVPTVRVRYGDGTSVEKPVRP